MHLKLNQFANIFHICADDLLKISTVDVKLNVKQYKEIIS